MNVLSAGQRLRSSAELRFYGWLAGLVVGSDSWLNPSLGCAKRRAGIWKAPYLTSVAVGMGWLTGQAELWALCGLPWMALAWQDWED